MNKSPFTYEVITFDSFDLENKARYCKQQGMGLAETFAEAASIIERYYGTDLVSIKSLELFDESDLILMPQSCIRDFKRREYNGADYGKLFQSCDIYGNLYTEATECEKRD